MEKIKKGLNPIALLLTIGVLFLFSVNSYSYPDLLRVPINGKVQKRINNAIGNIATLKYQYEGSEEEKVYYETIIGWVTYILENYKTRFGDNKLIFIGGSCRRAYEAAIFLSKRYGINEQDIIYLDLPKMVNSTTREAIIYKYIEQQEGFKGNGPIAVFDDMVDSGNTLEKIDRSMKLKNIRLKVLYYLLYDMGLPSYALDFPAMRAKINTAALFMRRSADIRTDVRRGRLISYKVENYRVAPEYLYYKDLLIFLSEIKKGDNIFALNKGVLSIKSREILPLIYKIVIEMGFHPGHSPNWAEAYDKLQDLCLSNSSERADKQDRLFFDLLQQHSLVKTRLLPKSRQSDL